MGKKLAAIRRLLAGVDPEEFIGEKDIVSGGCGNRYYLKSGDRTVREVYVDRLRFWRTSIKVKWYPSAEAAMTTATNLLKAAERMNLPYDQTRVDVYKQKDCIRHRPGKWVVRIRCPRLW